MDRQSWGEYFFNIAQTVATRSTCLRRQVGAVAVNRRHRIIATGYNGAPSSMDHCTKETCIRTAQGIPSGTGLEICYALHAEQNLVVQSGEDLYDSTVYCTNQPCTTCIKLLIGCGVREVYWKNPYPDEFSMQVMSKAGIIINAMDNDKEQSQRISITGADNKANIQGRVSVPANCMGFVNLKFFS